MLKYSSDGRGRNLAAEFGRKHIRSLPESLWEAKELAGLALAPAVLRVTETTTFGGFHP
jgi:hypothetical protein